MNRFNCTKIRGLANQNSWVEVDQVLSNGEYTYHVFYATYNEKNGWHRGLKIAKTKEKAYKIFEDKCAQYKIF